MTSGTSLASNADFKSCTTKRSPGFAAAMAMEQCWQWPWSSAGHGLPEPPRPPRLRREEVEFGPARLKRHVERRLVPLLAVRPLLDGVGEERAGAERLISPVAHHGLDVLVQQEPGVRRVRDAADLGLTEDVARHQQPEDSCALPRRHPGPGSEVREGDAAAAAVAVGGHAGGQAEVTGVLQRGLDAVRLRDGHEMLLWAGEEMEELIACFAQPGARGEQGSFSWLWGTWWGCLRDCDLWGAVVSRRLSEELCALADGQGESQDRLHRRV